MRALAEGYLSRERASHTLQPTALVHEAYLRLADKAEEGLDKGHLIGIAARTMRQVLVDHARRKLAKKRGGDRLRVTMPALSTDGGNELDLLQLHECLEELRELDDRKCRLVELRYFAGLSVRETAEVLGISHRTVEDDWAFTRTWLRTRLEP